MPAEGDGVLTYQAPFAEAVKKAVGDKMLVGTVGTIRDGNLAEEILQKVRTISLFGNQDLFWSKL